MPDALCIGEALIVFTPPSGQTVDEAETFYAFVAGAEVNVAIGLAAGGRSVAWAGLVGDDPFGMRVVTELQDAGVDASAVETVPGGYTGVYVKPGDGSSVRYYRKGSAGSQLTPALINRVALSRSPRLVHVSGVTAQGSEAGHEALAHLLTARPFGDALVSFDVNHRQSLATPAAAERLRELARRADIVFVGLDEAASIWGTLTIPQVRELLPQVPWLIVKDGGNVAVEFHAGAVIEVDAEEVEIVEPTGAGDAFAAGWLDAFLNGSAAPQRLAAGHRGASRVLRSREDHIRRSDRDDDHD